MIFKHAFRLARACFRDTAGSIAPISALIVVGAIGATAISVDGNAVRSARLDLLAAADASALAGVKAVARGFSPTTNAIALAEVNLPPEKYGNVLPPSNVEKGAWDSASRTFTRSQDGSSDGNAVRVTLEMSEANGNPLTLALAGVLGTPSANIKASAIAATMQEPLCLLALDPDGAGIRLEQNNDIFTANCTIWSNATSSESIAVMHSSGQFDTGDAKPCAVGGVFGDFEDFSAFPKTPCAHKDDPLADHALPTWGGLSESCPPEKTNVIVKPNESRVFQPGTYCGGISIKPNAEANGTQIRFEPGVYIFTGDFDIASNNEIRGDNVLFHFVNGAGLSVASNVEFGLTGRTADDTEFGGLLISQERTNPGTFEIRANTDFNLEGVVYLPVSTLRIGADTHIAIGAPWLSMIVKDLVLESNADVTLNIDHDVSAVPFPEELAQMFTSLVR